MLALRRVTAVPLLTSTLTARRWSAAREEASAASTSGNKQASPSATATGAGKAAKKKGWIHSVPRGVREFIGIAPFMLVLAWAVMYFDTFFPEYGVFDKSKHLTGPPTGESLGTFHLEPIYGDDRKTVVGYRHVKHKSKLPEYVPEGGEGAKE